MLTTTTKRNNSKQSTTTTTGAPSDLAARLLVLGGAKAGKSASIVRFTTGRYIHEYGRSTGDWLCRRKWAGPARRGPQAAQGCCVELLEQGDLEICNTSNLFQQVRGSLGDGLELAERQRLLEKLHWAHAFVIVYAIDDVATFNKAIKYLNLIANSVNSAPHSVSSSSSPSSWSSSSLSSSSTSSSASSSWSAHAATPPPGQQQQHHQDGRASLGSIAPQQHHLAGRLFALSRFRSGSTTSSSSSSSSSQVAAKPRPILLLGNKRDLERGARQVSARDGRLLAMRHQSMFAEVSVAESSGQLEEALASLLDQLEPHLFAASRKPLHQLPAGENSQLASYARATQTSPVAGCLEVVGKQPKLAKSTRLAKTASPMTSSGLGGCSSSSKMVLAKLETVDRCSSQLATTANVIGRIKKFVASH